MTIPGEARWISAEERDYLEATLHEESRELDSAKPGSRILAGFAQALMCWSWSAFT